MESIAAVQARIAEICQRVAQLSPPPTPPSQPPERFEAVLATHTSGSDTQVDGWIRQAMAATGVPPGWAQGLRAIAEHESGFDATATNTQAAVGGEHAAGLMQMLPSTFRAHAAPGHADIYNPVDNLIAAIRYIGARYGDPGATPGLRSLAHGGPYRGY